MVPQVALEALEQKVQPVQKGIQVYQDQLELKVHQEQQVLWDHRVVVALLELLEIQVPLEQ